MYSSGRAQLAPTKILDILHYSHYSLIFDASTNYMSVKKNLVLGGSGMIGSHLCKYLLSKGEEVISLDLLSGFDLRKDALSQYKDVDFVWFFAVFKNASLANNGGFACLGTENAGEARFWVTTLAIYEPNN